MTPHAHYTIRAATEHDADTIRQMVRAAPLNPNRVDWRYFMVLEVLENDQPLVVSIAMIHPQDGFFELDSVVTRPAYRGRGYARAVIAAFLNQSPRPVYLLSEAELIGFYEQFGFRVVSPAAAPAAIREEMEYVNRYWGPYQIMGLMA